MADWEVEAAYRSTNDFFMVICRSLETCGHTECGNASTMRAQVPAVVARSPHAHTHTLRMHTTQHASFPQAFYPPCQSFQPAQTVVSLQQVAASLGH